MEAVTGSPLAILDAEYLTALRTGAASGLATDLLARKNADVLALFGAGVQAETQLEGVLAVRQIKETLVFGRTREKANAFCDRMREKFKIEIRSATNDELRHADIICAATTSATPVFESSQIKKGVHINGIGSFKPSMQEIPSTTIAQSTLIVDQKKAVLIEAGDVVIPIQQGIINENHIHAELGEIISGPKKGRTADGQVTVFKSVGNAIQDLALAHFLLRS